MRVLIADDDPVIRRLLEATLVKAGHEVVLASDGTETWRILPGATLRRWPCPTG